MRGAWILFAPVGVLLVAGASRLAYIETTSGDELRQRARQQQTATITIPAWRGSVLDTRGRVLAGTVRRPSAFVDPALVREPSFAAHSVAPVLDLDVGVLEQLLHDPPRPHFVWLRRRISDEAAEAFEAVIGARRLVAFGVQKEPMRVYPQGRVAPHVLGFVGRDLQGLAGIEQAFDETLTGEPIQRRVTVDVGRRRVRADDDGFATVVDGATVVLTIDAFVQQLVQDALREAIATHEAEWGTAVVMDPCSGEVLAMATYPDFDPAAPVPPGYNDMSEEQRGPVKELWGNRSIAYSYEPGSIFKPFIVSCALNDGLVRIDEVFDINGPHRRFGRRTIHDTHAYGSLPVYKIISKSSNIGMGLIGARCGNERLHDYVRRFGFGAATGIGLPGEHPGQVNRFANWTSFSTQSIPIGQEIGVTALQIVTAFGVFCNGGLLMQPRIVRGVIGPAGDTVADYSQPVVVRRVLDEPVAEMFRQTALVETVRDGTGRKAQLDGYQVFGKTGTAQVARLGGGGYLPDVYMSSFVGGAPSDQPRVVALVSLYNPSGVSYYGGTVAAPAVKTILAQTLEYMHVPHEQMEDAGEGDAEQ